MAGVKGRSGGWNKAQAVDYSMLKRYSLAHLLRLMRGKRTDKATKLKIALEVVGKDIGKMNFDNGSGETRILIIRNEIKPAEIAAEPEEKNFELTDRKAIYIEPDHGKESNPEPVSG